MTEAIALHIVRALYHMWDGWHPLGIFRGFGAEALQYAVERGWVIAEGSHSVAITDYGRQRVRG